MSFWTQNPHQPSIDAADSLARSPSGGPIKMWLAGFVCALPPLVYGTRCMIADHAVLPGQNSIRLDVHGPAADSLGIAYIAIGAFVHFHYFWGLHNRLHAISPILKVLAVLVFLGGFGRAIYLIFS